MSKDISCVRNSVVEKPSFVSKTEGTEKYGSMNVSSLIGKAFRYWINL